MGHMPARSTPPPAPFTPLDFQLVLLRRMADHNPGLVERARHGLGVSAAEMREANRRWQAMARGRGGARGARSRYRSILGAPESTARRAIGDLECEALLWPVPLWPDLRFEVLLAPGGGVWNEWLVRAPGVPGPALRTLADLTPWSCTVDEAARAFAPARPMEGTAPTRWRLAFTAPEAEGPDGARRRCVAEFTWGLLQRVEFPDGGPPLTPRP
ncbi:hypothetical protein AB0I16_07775 [Streptomyces sp. NPDC050703]|uniref:hypothetical protein n=1 Tax=Streptomyces sp. NPDC050703 TaxID=3157218 RepID=UPI00342B45BB